MGTVKGTVNQQQAAEILHLPLATIGMRIKRRNIKPVRGKGRNALYQLDQLKTH